jgi:hypothetical protein
MKNENLLRRTRRYRVWRRAFIRVELFDVMTMMVRLNAAHQAAGPEPVAGQRQQRTT